MTAGFPKLLVQAFGNLPEGFLFFKTQLLQMIRKTEKVTGAQCTYTEKNGG